MSHRNLKQPGFLSNVVDSSAEEEPDLQQPRKRRRVEKKQDTGDQDSSYEEEYVEDNVLTESEEDLDKDMPSTSGKKRRVGRKVTIQAGRRG